MHRIDKFGYEYSLKKLLGKGTYGQVCLYERVGELLPNPFNDFFYDKQLSKKKYCAIKYYFERLSNNEGLSCSTLRELNLMLMSDHPNIVGAHEAFYHRERIQVVMDFYLDLPQITHEDSINQDEDSKKLICYQITRGLAHLHENYIIHRDLKPQNIFISRDGFAKIGDFGMSKQYGTPNKKLTPYACTREYRAPQLFMNTNYYTYKADIWSLGCIYYYVYTGQTLFLSQSRTQLSLISKIFALTGTPDESNWAGYRKLPKIFQFQPYPKKSIAKEKGLPENISQLIESCLNLDPKKRPSASELLKNQFFSEFKQMGDLFTLNTSQIYDRKLQNILNKA